MRPQQNNFGNHKRGRGRNRNGGGGGGGGGGKPQNILHRNFESTGPDMKVRGTAQHVYEKYLQLARDANSSGDRVMAENYLQHAEHYYRIIAAAQAAMPQHQQNNQQNGNGQRQNGHGDADGNANGNRFDGPSNSRFESNDSDGAGDEEPTVSQQPQAQPVEDEQPVV